MTYERMEFVQGDIADQEVVRDALEGCDAIVNFAAESHVDRSIEEPGHFIQTDVYGTYVLLEEARERRASSATCRSPPTRSTARSRRARSPSRARSTPPPRTRRRRPAATCSVSAYCHTYGMDAIVCRASNNYGPYQYPEKLIPLCVLNALHGDPLPVYGDGMQVRNWLHVTDHCRGIDVVLR